MRPLVLTALALAPLTAVAAATAAPPATLVDLRFDSGRVVNSGATRDVAHRTLVTQAGAAWIRLAFEDVHLGEPPRGGRATLLRVSGVRDGASQHLTAEGVGQWAGTSAYFNGDAVIVEVVADPGAAPSRVTIAGAWAGYGDSAAATICGTEDDRVPSDDPRVGRIMPQLCTAWLIDDRCFLSAGHCAPGAGTVVEFNVPPSDAGGNEQHPGPEDQYAVDPASVQLQGAFLGNDWAYFGCFANTETGLTPGTAQGAWYELARALPPAAGQPLRVSGYGIDTTPLEYNRTQQSAVGPYLSLAGTLVHYGVDTTSGNSGSPVVDEFTGLAIAIHTHGGCDESGGANYGTSVEHTGLQAALANPIGVCAPACPADADGDSQVGVSDLVLVVLAWGSDDPAADVNGDSTVDVLDLAAVVLSWGECG